MKKKLSEYLDGLLDAEEKAYVEEHVASCPDCAATLAELEKTLGHMRTLDEVEPPPWFAEKVMKRVHGEAAKRSLLRKLFFPLHIKVPAEALALVLVAIVAVYVFDAMRPEMAMEGPSAPKREIAAEEPEADVLRSQPFHHPEDEALKPFAPSAQVREPEEEGWEHEEIGGTGAQEYALKEEARVRGVGETGEMEVKKREAAPEGFRAKEPARPLRDKKADVGVAREAPAPEAQEAMDRLDMEKVAPEAKAVPPEPGLRLSVGVGDLEFARHEVEEAITGLGGRLIDEEGVPENVVMAELDSVDVDELIEAVSEMGEIKSKTLRAEGGLMHIWIEIYEYASQ
jgi:hypothetical protein